MRAFRDIFSPILWFCIPKPPSSTCDWASSWDDDPWARMVWSMFPILMRATTICRMWRVPADLAGMDQGKRISECLHSQWMESLDPASAELPPTPLAKCPHGMMHDPWAGMIPKHPKCTRPVSTSLQCCGRSWICPIQVFAQDCVNYDGFLNCLEGLSVLSQPPLKELRWHSWSSHLSPPFLSQLFIMQHHQDCSQTGLVSYKRHWQILLVDRRVVGFFFLLKILKSHFSLET